MKESWTDMFIGCTGKVAKYIQANVVDTTFKEEKLYSWQVTQFNVLGNEILLFMNVHTRFPLFMHKNDGLGSVSLQDRFGYLFTQVMKALHVPKEGIDVYLRNQNWTYGKIVDRSVLSQMNDLAYIYKFNVVNGNHSYDNDLQASITYADIPCIKADIYPKKEMTEAMKHLFLCVKEAS